MKTRLIAFAVIFIVVLIGAFFIFSTAPTKDNPTSSALPTINVGEKLTGESLDGQLLFSRGGFLWAWRGDTGLRMAIEPGASVIAGNQPILLQATLSPNGATIAYIRQDESYSDLWLINADGKNPRRLTNNRGPGLPRSQGFSNDSLWAFNPAWSPDGNIIAYLTDRGTDDLTLWLWSLKNNNAARVTMLGAGQGGVGKPSWSPDGTRLAIAAYQNGKSQIFRVNVQNGQNAQITESDSGAYDPAWSPNAQSIAYVVRKGNLSELWVMNADGTNPLLAASVPSRYPAWSPKGDKIAFLGLKDGAFELYTVDFAGGVTSNIKQITKSAHLDSNGGLSWSK
ncbi:MAG: PD40 domain-containing protein [Chloroflexi bacterium]|uniref:PD40 domain-containing protein n=1 Tax=Candidatus Chlorohelix allophototropha TaxID=3003348 RepID=A0A8T7M9Z9_9CHLR|nr:PD40 domain-containing protein [Chloroflexota bacterium]WJW68803.1 hypothetical protein OZ401_004421 [Chloroflexota bacterium L227-S17]